VRLAAPLLSGLLFAVGLGVAGMTLPENVLAFLAFRDPGLLLTMGGATAVTLLGFPRVLRRERPVFGLRFVLPTRRDIDRPLIVGAALFGVGWGLVGLCPGPATRYRTSATFFPVGRTRRMNPGSASQVTSYIFARALHSRTNAALIMTLPPTPEYRDKFEPS
jgi:uncharacterized membrane protein YedE/YeeE